MARDAGSGAMHTGLRNKLGTDLAEEVIDVLAPLERGELARQSDVEAARSDLVLLEGRVGERLGKIEGRLGELVGEMRRIDGRIDAQGATLEAKIDAQGAKIDAQGERLEGRIDAQFAKLLYVLVPIMIALVGLVFGVAFAVAGF